MTWRESFGPLRERDFAWFYAARVVSTAGSTMAPIALAFAVLDVSASASALGLVLAARTVPMLVFLLLGGVVSDRLPRATVIQVANLLTAVTQAGAAGLVISGHAEIWMLMALEAANGAVSASPCRRWRASSRSSRREIGCSRPTRCSRSPAPG